VSMTVHALIEEGLQSLGRGELDEAAFYFEEVVAREPHNPTAASYLRHLSRSGYRCQRGRAQPAPSFAGWVAPPPQARKYEVLKKLAQGGICEIYLAQEVEGASPGRPCVLKLLRRNYIGDPNLHGAMKNEAQILSLLRHPNVVQFYGPVRISDREGLALEVLEGCTVNTLSQLYNGRPNLAEGLAIMAQAFETLGYVHQVRGPDGGPLKIVHRDIAPGNIFLTVDGRVKLLDFGVSRWARSIHKTKQGVLKGTPSFMSPEQARGAHVSASSDLFSAGLVLLSLLTGSGSPFQKGSLGATLIAVSEGLRPPVAQLLPKAPAGLVQLIESLLAPTPRDRPSSATEVSTVLRQTIDALGVGVGRAVLQDVASRARSSNRPCERTVSGVAAPAARAETAQSAAPVLETDSLAQIFESIEAHLDDLTLTARTLAPAGDESGPGGPPGAANNDAEPLPTEPLLEGRQAIGFEAHETDLLDGGEHEAETVVVVQSGPEAGPQPTEAGAWPAAAPTQECIEPHEVAALRGRRGRGALWLGLCAMALLGGSWALLGRPDAVDEPASPARAGRRSAAPSLPSWPKHTLKTPEAPDSAPAPALSSPQHTSALPEAPPSALTATGKSTRQVRRTGARPSRRRRATLETTPAEPSHGTVSVRCPSPWQASLRGAAELSSAGPTRTPVSPGTYRLVIKSGARRHSATVLVAAGSPVLIECPWSGEAAGL